MQIFKFQRTLCVAFCNTKSSLVYTNEIGSVKQTRYAEQQQRKTKERKENKRTGKKESLKWMSKFSNFWAFPLWFYLKFSNSLDLDWTCEMLQCGAHLLQNALTKRTVEAGNEKMTTPLTAAQVGVKHCPAIAIIRGHSLMVTGRLACESFR